MEANINKAAAQVLQGFIYQAREEMSQDLADTGIEGLPQCPDLMTASDEEWEVYDTLCGQAYDSVMDRMESILTRWENELKSL